MKASESLTAPAYLAPATRAWWEATVGRWQLEDHHKKLLTLAAEAWDRGQQAREAIARDGLTTVTKDGGTRAHPAVRIESDCRLAFARLVRELDLDLEAPAAASRPAPLRSVR
jgi:P27 family predicted phage terminase small subunit